jgi:hypothetical protein
MEQRNRIRASGNADEQATAAGRPLQPWDFLFKRHSRTVPENFPTSIEYLQNAPVEARESTNHTDMKSSLIITAAIAALTLFGGTNSAEARSRHKHSSSYCSGSYRYCDTPVHRERYFIGYDRCGYPVWGYRTVRSYCPPPRAYCPPPRPYHYRPAVCPPRYPYRSSPPRSGVVISGVFGL